MAVRKTATRAPARRRTTGGAKPARPGSPAHRAAALARRRRTTAGGATAPGRPRSPRTRKPKTGGGLLGGGPRSPRTRKPKGGGSSGGGSNLRARFASLGPKEKRAAARRIARRRGR